MVQVLTIYAKTYTEMQGAMHVIPDEINNGNRSGYVGDTLWKLEEVDEVWMKKEHLPEKSSKDSEQQSE